MDRRTVDVYEQQVDDWIVHRRRPTPATLPDFVARVPAGPRADLGCGPGWHSDQLGAPVVSLDAAFAMTQKVREFAPDAWPVQGDLERLPFRPGALAGAWAHKSYMHVPATHVPLALAEAHRSIARGGALHVQVTSDRQHENADDIFPGRHFEWWPAQRLRDVIEGAGFTIDAFVDDGEEWIDVEATRAHMLPDTVGPDMRLLLVGLNPSILSADLGVGFARPGNRFWPAALASGMATRTHDPYDLFRTHGVGMTNQVVRETGRTGRPVSHARRRHDEPRPPRHRAGRRTVER
jgi:hypothetical protein